MGFLLASADWPSGSVATSDVDGEGESAMGIDDESKVDAEGKLEEGCPCSSVRRLFGGGSSPTATFSIVNSTEPEDVPASLVHVEVGVL